VPESIRDARVRVLPHANGGVFVAADADCTDEASANAVADHLRRMLARYRSNPLIWFTTAGILNAIVIKNEGAGVHVTLDATERQVDRAIDLILMAIKMR
jgi:hypothetical protein